MKHTEVRNNPTTFLALTSVNVILFDEILPFFTVAHNENFRWHDVKGKKISRKGSHVIQSGSPLLTVADRLFLILVFLKNNITQEYHGESFGMAQQQCGQWIHTLTEVFHMALDDAEKLPATTMDKFKKLLDEWGGGEVVHELIHDGTEREIPRPSDPDLQKEYYSGKKKRHTVKNAVITCLAGFILFCGQTAEGKMHDRNIADTRYSFPYGCILRQYTGYQGYKPDNVTIIQPTKKSEGKELTEEQKSANTDI